ncbi:energy transducer TonB [Rhodopila sp.]|jgi:protein TonB|uniref:energy transducer TonB n=1 Tax=Rhodopila sp. TaxID=2480087 RepID=UPI002C8A03C0|nr:energy transducer TonB [Rhodopila sp.]HVZ08772.1 energy transducer TonB [Rhodopila sp.]
MPWVVVVAVSVVLHLLLGGATLIGLHLRRPVPPPPAEGTVELLMVERKGDAATAPASPADARPPPAPAESPPTPRVAKPDAAPSGRPAEPTTPSAEPVPPPAPAPAPQAPGHVAEHAPDKPDPDRQAEAPRPPAPDQPSGKPREALTFDLNGTDSLSNAEASGDHIIPASPDDRFRNRPPVYPREAAMRGDAGAVVLMIHVAADGRPSGIDVVRGSGHATLDQAAIEAVRKWRFRPALQDGRVVPFDMPMRFIFEVE